MSNKKTTYNLNLKNLLTGEFKVASQAVHEFGGYLEEATQKAQQLHDAEAQLANTMKDMGTYSDQAFNKAIQGAADLSKNILFSQADIISFQAQLGLTGDIGDKEMQQLISASADMATKFGGSLKDVGNGIVSASHDTGKLRDLGGKLNIDSKTLAHLQNLEQHGRTAQARLELVAIAEQKVGGAAKAAFDANPMAQYNKAVEDLQVAIGGVANTFLQFLSPAIKWIDDKLAGVTDRIREFNHWCIENEGRIKLLAGIVATLAGAYMAFNAWQIITYMWMMREEVKTALLIILKGGLTSVTVALTAAQTALNAAWLANPVGLVIAALAGLGLAIYAIYKHSFRLQAGFAGAMAGIKAFGHHASTILKDLAVLLFHVYTFQFWKIGGDVSRLVNDAKDAGSAVSKAYSETYNSTLADLNKKAWDEKKKDDQANAPVQNPSPQAAPANSTGSANLPSPASATGTKAVTLTVNINGGLVHDLKIMSSTITEGANKMKEIVANALLEAANDFSMQADI